MSNIGDRCRSLITRAAPPVQPASAFRRRRLAKKSCSALPTCLEVRWRSGSLACRQRSQTLHALQSCFSRRKKSCRPLAKKSWSTSPPKKKFVSDLDRRTAAAPAGPIFQPRPDPCSNRRPPALPEDPIAVPLTNDPALQTRFPTSRCPIALRLQPHYFRPSLFGSTRTRRAPCSRNRLQLLESAADQGARRQRQLQRSSPPAQPVASANSNLGARQSGCQPVASARFNLAPR